ncbi:hypothetical protein [Paenibacillus periandrae]|uniref:hypothetical protein n=1 Tax=Paenibacillus periandrae TaxID=1761741 RepID=UPI001F09EA90|nr:hypothetical protein [Paenibacillus periandrae]
MTEVQSAAADQNVVYSLSYLNGTAVNTLGFIVGKIPATITSVSAVNGSITVKFAAGSTVSEATYQKLLFKQSIDGMTLTDVTATSPVLDSVNNAVPLPCQLFKSCILSKASMCLISRSKVLLTNMFHHIFFIDSPFRSLTKLSNERKEA